MLARIAPDRVVAAGAVICAMALACPTFALAQTSEIAAPGTRLAWLGCWELIASRGDGSAADLEGRRLVCLEPGDRPNAMALTSLVDDEVVLEHTLVTDGNRQPVTDDGSSGWERAMLSADGRRVYMQSEMGCTGDNRRILSGVSMMTSGDRWLDIHVVRVDGERELMIRRYRAVESNRQPTALGPLRTAVRTARLAAASPLTPDDVIEALAHVDPAVVEAMLLETQVGFAMNAKLLLYLADAEVPPGIIDLMVALSFPEYFAIDDGTAAAAPPPPLAAAPGPVMYGAYWTPWFSPFRYGYYYPHPPLIVVPGTRYGGKVVSGRGYTRVTATEKLPSGGFAGLLKRAAGAGSSGGSLSSGSKGSVSKSGHSNGRSSSTRKAKRRGGD